MELGKIPNNPQAITRFFASFEPVFIQFDKDFIDKTIWGKGDGVIWWETWTEIYTMNIKRTKQFIREHLARNDELWSRGAIRIHDHSITFSEKEDVAYIGDDTYMLYMTPIVKISYPRYRYWVIKYIEFKNKKDDDSPEIILAIHAWNSKHATVEFKAKGKNRNKYYLMAKDAFTKYVFNL